MFTRSIKQKYVSSYDKPSMCSLPDEDAEQWALFLISSDQSDLEVLPESVLA